MTKEEKQLLLKDICARLPYGVKLDNGLKLRSIDVLTNVVSCSGSDRKVENIKPYLRPMSSMTEEEIETMWNVYENDAAAEGASKITDLLNQWHLDHHHLIEKGLALEAPEDMYKTQ